MSEKAPTSPAKETTTRSPSNRPRGPVFTTTVWFWLIVFAIMSLAIGSMDDESSIFSEPVASPLPSFFSSSRIYFANIFQRIGAATVPSYHRLVESLFVAPMQSAMISIFNDLGIASLFTEQQYGKLWLSCSELYDLLPADKRVNQPLFCKLLRFASSLELVEPHRQMRPINGGVLEIYYTGSFHGSLLSPKHQHADLTSFEKVLHRTLVPSSLLDALTRRLFNPEAHVDADPAALAALTSAYQHVLSHDPHFAQCTNPVFVSGAQVNGYKKSTADCVILQSTLPFIATKDLSTLVTELRQQNTKVFFLEFDDLQINHLINRYVSAYDLYLLAFGPPGAPSSSQTISILHSLPFSVSAPLRTQSPYFLFEITSN